MTSTAAFCCGVDTHCLAVIWANGGKEQKLDALCLSLLTWQAFGWSYLLYVEWAYAHLEKVWNAGRGTVHLICLCNTKHAEIFVSPS